MSRKPAGGIKAGLAAMAAAGGIYALSSLGPDPEMLLMEQKERSGQAAQPYRLYDESYPARNPVQDAPIEQTAADQQAQAHPPAVQPQRRTMNDILSYTAQPITPEEERAFGQDTYRTEREVINYTGRRLGVHPDLLAAIRRAENGPRGREFGAMRDGGRANEGLSQPREYIGTLEQQASQAAATVRRLIRQYNNLPEGQRQATDMLDYIRDTYAPIGAGNDPRGLNRNWRRNVGNALNEMGYDIR